MKLLKLPTPVPGWFHPLSTALSCTGCGAWIGAATAAVPSRCCSWWWPTYPEGQLECHGATRCRCRGWCKYLTWWKWLKNTQLILDSKLLYWGIKENGILKGSQESRSSMPLLVAKMMIGLSVDLKGWSKGMCHVFYRSILRLVYPTLPVKGRNEKIWLVVKVAACASRMAFRIKCEQWLTVSHYVWLIEPTFIVLGLRDAAEQLAPIHHQSMTLYIPMFELLIKQCRLSAHNNHAICSFGTLKLDSNTWSIQCRACAPVGVTSPAPL